VVGGDDSAFGEMGWNQVQGLCRCKRVDGRMSGWRLARMNGCMDKWREWTDGNGCMG